MTNPKWDGLSTLDLVVRQQEEIDALAARLAEGRKYVEMFRNSYACANFKREIDLWLRETKCALPTTPDREDERE